MILDVGENTKLKECEQLWDAEKDSITQKLPDLLSDSHRYVSVSKSSSVTIRIRVFHC